MRCWRIREFFKYAVDMEVFDNVPIEELNYETVHGYRNRHSSLKEGHLFGRVNDHEYLRSIGAAAISAEDKQLHSYQYRRACRKRRAEYI